MSKNKRGSKKPGQKDFRLDPATIHELVKGRKRLPLAQTPLAFRVPQTDLIAERAEVNRQLEIQRLKNAEEKRQKEAQMLADRAHSGKSPIRTYRELANANVHGPNRDPV